MQLETMIKILNIKPNTTIDEILDSLIIYLRKSRKDIEYNKEESVAKTLQRHEKELQDYIINIFGKPIPEYNIYREVASGDTIEDRPVIQEVLSLIESDKYKAVICIEIERLARGNTMDQGIIAQTFQYTETKIITPFKIYNLDDEDDLSYFEDGLYQARKYLKYTKKILNRGRVRSVKDGKYIGSVLPYGFNKIKLENEKGYVLVENKTEADIIRLIADLFLNGLHINYTVKETDTISSIAKLFGLRKKEIINNNLNLKIGKTINIRKNLKNITYQIEKNDTIEKIANKFCVEEISVIIPNTLFEPAEIVNIDINDMRCINIAHYLNYLKFKPRKSLEWTSNIIRNILQSYAVYGYLTWDKRKTTKILKDGKIIKNVLNNNDYTLAKGRHQAILSEEIGLKIKEKFEKNKRKKVTNNKELKNPLASLVKCGYCGNNMIRRPYTKNKNTKPQKRRLYSVDKDKLRLLLREQKGNLSYSEIGKMLNISKDRVCHFFATDVNKMVLPTPEIWNNLKEILNIKTTEFDKALKTYETYIPIHEDTLICSKLRCTCVASNLSLVEERVLKQLANILKDYKIYINNYKEEIKKEIFNKNNLIENIEQEISKRKSQIEKACELIETGAYSQEMFILRTTKLNNEIADLIKQKNELNNTSEIEKKYNNHKKAIPILENIIKTYKTLTTAEEKNKLLSSIIKEIIYTKDKGGLYLKDNFKLKIIMRL